MRVLTRLRPAPARLAALAVVLVGALLLLLAIARATIWAPSSVTVVHVAGQAGVPVVDTTPEALALDGPSVHVDVRAADPTRSVFVGVGRADDVEAYLGGAARTEVTGVRGKDAVLTRVGSDASLPEPAGVDIWALATTGRGSAALTWPQAAGRWRLVAAVDGATPPTEVVLSWQRDRGSSPVPALFAVGALLLVLGLVGVRATRGRTPPATQRPERPVAAAPGAGVAGTVSAGAAGTSGETGAGTSGETAAGTSGETAAGTSGETAAGAPTDAPATPSRGTRRQRLDVRERPEPDEPEDTDDTDEPDEPDEEPAPAPFRLERGS